MKTRIISKIIILSLIFICLFSAIAFADGVLMQRGDKSEDVAILQQMLMEKGYFSYETITGYYGKITEDAVKEFQFDNGLRVDGITGSATWEALLSLSENDGTYNDSEITYSKGMESEEIAEIQAKLKELGFYNYDYITGYFGSITQMSVESFQLVCFLDVTGIVDNITWSKLFNDSEIISLPPGTVGEAVIPLQNRLSELGYYSFKIDGYYGEKTKDAIIYFQKVSGIMVTGFADKETQKLLFSDEAISEQQARRTITSTNNVSLMAIFTLDGESIVEIAKEYLGYPYIYGAQGPDAFDCDGFVKYIYELAGYNLPESILGQNYDNFGVKISNRTDLQLGDLVFFDTLLTDGNLTNHVGIYIGDGYFIHVDKIFGNKAVVIETMSNDNGWYSAWFSWGRRITDIN